ncbi:MAG: tetratricopeptide repeat protein [Gemmatimonadales bacterium]
MTDDIAAMTLELAQDPNSLVFLRLAEALRRKGQLDAALTVASRGAGRYPESADAHDLLARIHSDRGDGDAAFDSWTSVLRIAPDHLGAHKGLAFIAYRGGDLARSVRHLTRALELAPGDTSLASAIERIRTMMVSRSAGPTEAAPPADGPAGKSTADATPTLLFDQQGRVLRGQLERTDGTDASDAVAAALAGVSREADRAAQMLELGEWRAIAIESGAVNYELRSPTTETLLLVMRGREVPAGRLARIADKAVEQARRWLEELA